MAFVRHKSDNVFLSQAIHIMYILRLHFLTNEKYMYLQISCMH